MTEKEILEKLNSAAEELEKAINKQDKVHQRQNIRKVAKELRKCKELERIGGRWMPVNSLNVEISPVSLRVQKHNYKIKIRAVYSYAEKLIKELNNNSEFLKFKFSGVSFIGRFVRDNGRCIISIRWRY